MKQKEISKASHFSSVSEWHSFLEHQLEHYLNKLIDLVLSGLVNTFHVIEIRGSTTKLERDGNVIHRARVHFINYELICRNHICQINTYFYQYFTS